MGIHLNKTHIDDIANAVPGVVEQLLYDILLKYEKPED
jgi:hypothetical protein